MRKTSASVGIELINNELANLIIRNLSSSYLLGWPILFYSIEEP